MSCTLRELEEGATGTQCTVSWTTWRSTRRTKTNHFLDLVVFKLRRRLPRQLFDVLERVCERIQTCFLSRKIDNDVYMYSRYLLQKFGIFWFSEAATVGDAMQDYRKISQIWAI